jgi:HSP20 family protein
MFGPGFWRVGRMMNQLSEVQNLQREMNRLFSGFTQPFSHEFPPINVWLSKDDAVVSAEVPGIDTGKIDISVVADTITISGLRDKDELKEGESYHRQERSYGNFTRTLQVPFQVDAGRVEAKYDKGILRITLPRSEAAKPKKVTVRAE